MQSAARFPLLLYVSTLRCSLISFELANGYAQDSVVMDALLFNVQKIIGYLSEDYQMFLL